MMNLKSACHPFIYSLISLLLILDITGCVRRTDLHPQPTVEKPLVITSIAEKELPDISENSTIEDYIRYAALNNPGLEAAFNNWQAELQRIPQVSSLPDPKINYRYFIEEIETRVGPQRQALGISQMFPWFGKLRLRGDIARDSAAIANQEYEAAKRRLFLLVRSSYYEYYYLGRSIMTVEENRNLIRALEEALMTRYKTDSANYHDLIRSQVELGKLEDHLSSLKDRRIAAGAKLNAALNRPAEMQFPMPKVLPEFDQDLPSEDTLKSLLMQNPELLALSHKLAKAGNSVELARKDGAPDVMLGVDYIFTDEAIMPDVKDSGKDPFVAMLTINLPIWREKYRSEVREAESRRLSVMKALEEKENQLLAALQVALYDYRDAERKIDLYRDTLLPKAEQSLKATRQAFTTNKATFLDVIDAIRIFLDFKLSYERALVDHAKSIAEIEMLVGDIADGV